MDDLFSPRDASSVRELLEEFRSPPDVPAYRELAAYIERLVREGYLSIGERLPSERTLAAWIKMSRTTVQTAYQVLEARGLVETRPQIGTIIASTYEVPKEVADAIYRRSFAKRFGTRSDRSLWDLTYSSDKFDRYGFDVGAPDPDFVHFRELELAAAELFSSRRRELLDYGDPKGLESLRERLLMFLARYRGIDDITPDNILITNGSTQALSLIATAFLDPDDIVVTEDPTWPGAPRLFASRGARIAGFPIDEEGIDVQAFTDLIVRQEGRCKLIYLQPTLHNPTGVTMSDGRREWLRQAAAAFRVIVVEDDAYGALDSGPHPRAMFADRSGRPAIYVGTFSKMLGPGLRVGFVVGEPGVIDHLAELKQLHDLQCSSFAQLLVEAWLSMADVDGFLRSARAAYASRLATAVSDPLFSRHARIPLRPRGDGYYVYGEFSGERDARAVRELAHTVGVSFGVGEAFAVSRSTPHAFRLSVGRTSEQAITAGLLRLSRALDEQ